MTYVHDELVVLEKGTQHWLGRIVSLAADTICVRQIGRGDGDTVTLNGNGHRTHNMSVWPLRSFADDALCRLLSKAVLTLTREATDQLNAEPADLAFGDAATAEHLTHLAMVAHNAADLNAVQVALSGTLRRLASRDTTVGMASRTSPSIPVVCCHGAGFPDGLCDRWGHWKPAVPEVREFSTKVLTLQDRYGQGVVDAKGTWRQWAAGDPRLFMSSRHGTTCVAERNGLIGILSVVPLVPAASTRPTAPMSSAEALALTVAPWRLQLEPVQKQFLHSEIFLAHELPIFEDRVAVCAFTPLLGQKDQVFLSPYDAADGRSEAVLDVILNDMVQNPTPL